MLVFLGFQLKAPPVGYLLFYSIRRVSVPGANALLIYLDRHLIVIEIAVSITIITLNVHQIQPEFSAFHHCLLRFTIFVTRMCVNSFTLRKIPF